LIEEGIRAVLPGKPSRLDLAGRWADKSSLFSPTSVAQSSLRRVPPKTPGVAKCLYGIIRKILAEWRGTLLVPAGCPAAPEERVRVRGNNNII
jgi:hypothetical protein